MGSMRFMSTLRSQPTKIFSFDSSPGHAIAVALGAGLWDEKSYKSELKEGDDDEKTYEVSLRQIDSEHNPGPHPLQKVGVIHWSRPRTRSGRVI